LWDFGDILIFIKIINGSTVHKKSIIVSANTYLVKKFGFQLQNSRILWQTEQQIYNDVVSM